MTADHRRRVPFRELPGENRPRTARHPPRAPIRLSSRPRPGWPGASRA